MSLLPSTLRAVWQSAELLIVFHKSKSREARANPYFWRPKGAFARLLAKPEDQEAVVDVRGMDEADDVQIKMHADKIVVRRDRAQGWSGVMLDAEVVRIRVNGAIVCVEADGSVEVVRDNGKTRMEGQGAIHRVTPDMTVFVSPDGRRMSRDTEDLFVGFTPDGLVSRRK